MTIYNFILNNINTSNDFSIIEDGKSYVVELSLNRNEIREFLDNMKLPIGTLRFGNEIRINGENVKFVSLSTINKSHNFRVERERPVSSNVRFLRYYTNTNKLQVGFWNRSVYEYDGVTPALWENIRTGNAYPKTTGSNSRGSWDTNKYPSFGAAIHQYLIDMGYEGKKL